MASTATMSSLRRLQLVRYATAGGLRSAQIRSVTVLAFEPRPTSSTLAPAHRLPLVRGLAQVASRTSRKKKKKLESKEGDEPIPKLYNFVSEAEQLLGVVHEALLPFQAPANEGFVMNAKYRDSNDKRLEEVELVCGKEGGAFQFKIDAKNEVINAATPVSGALQYYFDGDKWLNVHDHHDIRGIIVRDMLRLTSSAPKL